MEKPAPTEHDIHPLLRDRFSPRAFADRPVAPETLRSLFEAARWAPSCFNEQPWRFVFARRGEGAAFARIAGLLNPKNKRWAELAPVLVVTVASTSFAQNGKPNAYARHDVGLAVGQLLVQATAMGLRAHQMAGFDKDKAREVLGIPEGFEPVAAMALGYPGAITSLPEELREREAAPRTRKPQSELVFEGAWDAPWSDGAR